VGAVSNRDPLGRHVWIKPLPMVHKCRDPADCMPIRSLRYFLAKRILTEVFAELNPEEPKT
jgi:hypothetical protein